jgi:hypothetical protein
MAYTTVHRRLRALVLPIRTGRAAALRELVLHVPAPAAAEALGFHHHPAPARRRQRNLVLVRDPPVRLVGAARRNSGRR